MIEVTKVVNKKNANIYSKRLKQTSHSRVLHSETHHAMNVYFISEKYKYVKNKSPFIYKVNTKKSYFDYRISGITRRLPFIQKKSR